MDPGPDEPDHSTTGQHRRDHWADHWADPGGEPPRPGQRHPPGAGPAAPIPIHELRNLTGRPPEWPRDDDALATEPLPGYVPPPDDGPRPFPGQPPFPGQAPHPGPAPYPDQGYDPGWNVPPAPGPPPGSPQHPPPGPGRSAGPLTATLGDALGAVGCFFVLLGSVLPFVRYGDSRFATEAARQGLDTWWTAWSPQTFLAPLTWLVVLVTLGVTTLTVLRVLGRREPVALGFSAAQLRLVGALFSLVVLFSYALSHKTIAFGSERTARTGAGVEVGTEMSFASGGYLMLFGAILLTVGAILTHFTQGGPVVWPLPDDMARSLGERARRLKAQAQAVRRARSRTRRNWAAPSDWDRPPPPPGRGPTG